MDKAAKKVGDIFSDYNTKSNIKYAYIKGLNVLKKTNTLQVIIYIDEYIEMKDIWDFEKFLMQRFHFEKIDIKIEYHEKTQKKSIQKEWKNLIAYMSHKYPLAKPMLLLKSDIQENENEIVINMHIKGAEFLKAKKADKELQNVIENLFGKKYKISIIENLSQQDIQDIEEKIKNEEAQIIADIEKNRPKNVENQENIPVREVEKINLDIVAEVPEENFEIKTKNDNKYILGKISKAKENNVKIKDITSDEGRVTLEGRVLSSEVRETKSGKGILIIEIYDGTGIITCKSFTKDISEGKEVLTKVQNSKSIKLIRKSWIRYICRRYNSNSKYNN